MSRYRLTIVVDNQAADGLVREHGFALLIDTPEGAILLDSGQKEALRANVEALGLTLDRLAILVLSHGHYDHTGGLPLLLGLNRDLDIYLHAAVFQPRYSLDGSRANIVKMPLAAMEAVMHHREDKVHWLTRPLHILPGVGLTGPIPRNRDFEDTGGRFFLDPEGRTIDRIQDDNALWIEGDEGLIVCLGCCHAGLLNTLDHIVHVTGEKRIAMIIGGLHLLHADHARLEKTVAGLQKYTIGTIVACHCSGDAAIDYLAAHASCTVTRGYAGMHIEL